MRPGSAERSNISGSDEQQPPPVGVPKRSAGGASSYQSTSSTQKAELFLDSGDVPTDETFARLIVDTIREGLLVLDLDYCVRAANESFYRMFDVSPEETEGHQIFDLGNGQWEIPKLRELLEQVLPENQVFNDFEVDHEFDRIGRRVMLLNARQLDHRDLILLAIEDVTEGRKSAWKLYESEDRYEFFIENAQEYAIFHLDADGRITSWNRGAQRVFGYTADEAIGKPGAMIFTKEDREAGEPEHEIATAVTDGRAADERWHVRKDGSRFWASGAMEAIRDPQDPADRVRGFTKILRDNTERKRAEEALRSLNEQLEQRVEERTQEVRQLASTLTMAEQEERRRVSQILHDDLQQILYGIQVKLDAISSDLEEGRDGRIGDNIRGVREWMDMAIDTTRRLTVDLSPPVLKSERLNDMLDWLRMRMQEVHNLEVTVESSETHTIPDEDLRVLLYQIVRELLFNVVKHAEADRASVKVESLDGHLRIRVCDEGRGFDVAEAARRTGLDAGFGLFSIRDRLQLLRGRIDIDSAPGKGTCIMLLMPRK